MFDQRGGRVLPTREAATEMEGASSRQKRLEESHWAGNARSFALLLHPLAIWRRRDNATFVHSLTWRGVHLSCVDCRQFPQSASAMESFYVGTCSTKVRLASSLLTCDFRIVCRVSQVVKRVSNLQKAFVWAFCGTFRVKHHLIENFLALHWHSVFLDVRNTHQCTNALVHALRFEWLKVAVGF